MKLLFVFFFLLWCNTTLMGQVLGYRFTMQDVIDKYGDDKVKTSPYNYKLGDDIEVKINNVIEHST